jgi:hypothetical protein
VRKQVELEYLVEQRRDLKNATYLKLREGYEIVIETGSNQSAQ